MFSSFGMTQWHYPRDIVDFFSPRASVHSHLEDLVWSCEPLIEMLYSYKTGPKKLRLLRWLWFNFSLCVISITVPWVWRSHFSAHCESLGCVWLLEKHQILFSVMGWGTGVGTGCPLVSLWRSTHPIPAEKSTVSPWRGRFHLPFPFTVSLTGCWDFFLGKLVSDKSSASFF